MRPMVAATDPLALAVQTAKECAVVADRLSRHGARVKTRLMLLRGGATIVGVTALAAEYLPKAQQILGPAGQSVVSLVAALTLIVGSMSFMILSDDPPSRFTDYARYIDEYGNHLREIAANNVLDAELRTLRLLEIARLANANLSDVRSLWPWARYLDSEERR